MRFAIIGALATLVHVAMAFITHHGLAQTPLRANVFGFFFGWWVSYLGNYHWTFNSDVAHHVGLSRFMVMSLFGLGLTLGIVWLMTDLLGAPMWAAMLVMVMVVPPTNYTIGKVWVFRAQPIRRQVRGK